MKDVDGEFMLEDQGDGTTLATYSLRIDAGVWMPGPSRRCSPTGDAAVGGGPQGARRGARPDPHRPHPSLAPPASTARTRSCWRSRAGSTRGRWRAVCVLPERGELAPNGWRTRAPRWSCTRWRCCGGGSSRPAGAAAPGAGGARATARELGALARERGAALVHSNTSVVLSGGAVARRAGVPHSCTCARSTRALPGAPGRSCAAGCSRADALACISRRGAEPVRGLGPGAPDLRRAAADARAARPRGRRAARSACPPTPFVAALVGRLSDWKGQDVLADALARAPRGSARSG